MLSKRYESTEADRRTWLHMPSGTHWSTTEKMSFELDYHNLIISARSLNIFFYIRDRNDHNREKDKARAIKHLQYDRCCLIWSQMAYF